MGPRKRNDGVEVGGLTPRTPPSQGTQAANKRGNGERGWTLIDSKFKT